MVYIILQAEQLHSTLNQPLLDFNYQEVSLNNSHNDYINSPTSATSNYDVKDLDYNKAMFAKLTYVMNDTRLLNYDVIFSYDVLIR